MALLAMVPLLACGDSVDLDCSRPLRLSAFGTQAKSLPSASEPVGRAVARHFMSCPNVRGTPRSVIREGFGRPSGIYGGVDRDRADRHFKYELFDQPLGMAGVLVVRFSSGRFVEAHLERVSD